MENYTNVYVFKMALQTYTIPHAIVMSNKDTFHGYTSNNGPNNNKAYLNTFKNIINYT